MESLFSIERTFAYSDRIRALEEHHVALWDVIGSCSRAGSGDADIRGPVRNDILAFVSRNPGLRLIAFNGNAAGTYFDQTWIRGTLGVVTLPSTSPANARLTVGEKTDRWRVICRYLE